MATDSTTRKNKVYFPQRIAAKIAFGELVLQENLNRSRCWDVFAKIEDLKGDEIKGFVLCRLCRKVFKFKNFSSSNLVRHKCYLDKYGKKQESELSIIKVEAPKLEDQEDIENASNALLKLITKWLINDCKPYDVIKDTGLMPVFQEFISLGAMFGTDIDLDKFLPDSTTIARNVSEMYEQCFHRVKAEIATIKEKGFGLTTDIWTDSYTKQSYIALTIHYLKNGAFTFCLMGLKAIDGEKCTTQNIYETIETILKDFDCELSNKSIMVTNGDIMKAFQNIQKLPCISLLIHNALQKSLENVPEIAELATACAKLVKFLKQLNLNADFSKSLQIYNPSRWITLNNMLSCIESNWSEICLTLENQNEGDLIETININYLTAVTKTLQPFENAIQNLEEDNDATLHLVLVYLHELKKRCDTNDSEFKDLNFIERLKENLYFNLETILAENITILHKIALFIYPPANKLLVFSDQEKKCIEDECRRLILENEPKPIIKPKALSIISTSMAKRNALFSDFVEIDSYLSDDELIIQELECYKKMRVENSETFDCFNWWELHKDVFPFLYKLSCIILATPASTASTQHVFSVAGSLLSEKINFGTNESEIEKIIFINFNGEQDELDSQQ